MRGKNAENVQKNVNHESPIGIFWYFFMMTIAKVVARFMTPGADLEPPGGPLYVVFNHLPQNGPCCFLFSHKWNSHFMYVKPKIHRKWFPYTFFFYKKPVYKKRDRRWKKNFKKLESWNKGNLRNFVYIRFHKIQEITRKKGGKSNGIRKSTPFVPLFYQAS